MECPFDLENDNQIEKFNAVDPYNPQNKLQGYINKRQGQLYGSLWITHVNGEESQQMIYSAPKQHYPFDKEDKWMFPECDYVDLYEKIDGTCIISYTYKDSVGNLFLTFKTRLRPFLGSGKFGNFLALWNEMLVKYPEIKNYCFNMYYNYVFEMFGKRNKILVEYDVPLDTKLIFSIDTSNGKIYPPDSEFKEILEVPMLESKGMLTNWHENNEDGKKGQYLKIQQELEGKLQINEDDKIIRGEEGYVWYFMKNQSEDLLSYAKQIKCKPPSILKYHWSGDAIPYESIYTTVINSFENYDNPIYDNIVELLKEEFDEEKIEKSRVRIEKSLAKIWFEKKSTYEIMKFYKLMNLNILKDKGMVMRALAKRFPKQVCCLAYPLIVAYEEGRGKV